MSQKANYFKLGLFVIGALVAGVLILVIIGTGRWFERRIIIETYFKESVQGLDIGSKLKYRGVTIGEVTKISFTYTKYQQDKPMSERLRYVLIEAQLQPKLLGGKEATEITGPEAAKAEVARGLRVRSAPQGITGTNYLEMDYVEPAPPLLPIDWTPDNAYIPSAPSTVTALVNAASEIMDQLRKVDIQDTVTNFNRLLVTTNAKIDAIDAKSISQRADRVLAKLEKELDDIAAKKISDQAIALIGELRGSNAELKKMLTNPAFQKLPDDTAAAVARVRAILEDPNINASLTHLSRMLGRLDRIFGTGENDLDVTFRNMRQITDNLRDLTEEAKRYPANIFLGLPPPQPERTK